MDICNEVADYLDGAGFGTVGTDIFVGQIPNNTNGIWVEQAGGNINNYVPVEDSVVNIFCKDTNSRDAITTLSNIKKYLHRMHNTTTANSYIYSFLVIGNIEDLQRDVEYAKVYKLSVSVMYRDTSIIS